MSQAAILRGIRRRAATICCTHDADLTLRLAREMGELVSRETVQKPALAAPAPAADAVVKRAKRVCAECDQPAFVRGLCSRHYHAARYAGRLQMHRPGQARFVDDPRAAAPELPWRGLPPPTRIGGTTEIH